MRELNGKVSEIILRFKAPEVITKQPLKQNNDPPKISENEDKIFMMSKHMEKLDHEVKEISKQLTSFTTH
jgi:hypothetical protein